MSEGCFFIRCGSPKTFELNQPLAHENLSVLVKQFHSRLKGTTYKTGATNRRTAVGSETCGRNETLAAVDSNNSGRISRGS